MIGRLAGLAHVAILGSAGCAWGPGEPFGEIETTLTTGWAVPADRDAGAGWQRLASDYQVRIDAASWTTTTLAFIQRGDAAAAFDPAMPPPGYSLCHTGHCHAADGRLVSYEDIAAELAGGTPPPPALELPLGELDLLAGDTLELACDGAPCPLGVGTIGRVELAVTRVMLAGSVRDSRVPARRTESPFALTLRLATPATPTGLLELPIDRGNSPRIQLDVGVHPTAAIFDAVDWARFGTGPEPITLESDPETMSTLTTAIGEVELALDVTRTD